jgi:transposase
VPDRNCVAALIFMARTSTPWSLLPAKELGCGSATTCWRRLDEWAKAGVFEQLQAVLLDELGEAGRIDLVLVNETLGPDWLTPEWFRLGASSLRNDCLMHLAATLVGYRCRWW